MIQKSIKILKTLAATIILSLCFVFNGNIKDSYYRDVVGDHVVKILNASQTGGGTGFHVITGKGKQYIVTNSHVCEVADKNDMVVVEKNGVTIPRKIIKRYSLHDLCLIEPVADHDGGIDMASNDSVGEDTIVIGHPGLRDLTLSHGEYIGTTIIELAHPVVNPELCNGKVVKDSLFFTFTGQYLCFVPFISSSISNIIYGGNSGSPVVNKYGNLVGVVFAGNRTQPNDSFMVPLRFVKDFLKGL